MVDFLEALEAIMDEKEKEKPEPVTLEVHGSNAGQTTAFTKRKRQDATHVVKKPLSMGVKKN